MHIYPIKGILRRGCAFYGAVETEYKKKIKFPLAKRKKTAIMYKGTRN